MNKDVPFLSNTDDDLHCLQAAFMMILRYFAPEKAPSWEAWAEITGLEVGKGTTPTAGLVWFASQGFDVMTIEKYDYAAFIKRGVHYIEERYPDSYSSIIAHSNIAREQERSREFIKLGINQDRNPTIQDITHAIDEGYLVCANVNAKQLHNLPGYSGHFVVIFDYDTDTLTIHDPGLPPVPNKRISYADFNRAWHLSDDDSAEMYAIRN